MALHAPTLRARTLSSFPLPNGDSCDDVVLFLVLGFVSLGTLDCRHINLESHCGVPHVITYGTCQTLLVA
jgi:hypothetical protein